MSVDLALGGSYSPPSGRAVDLALGGASTGPVIPPLRAGAALLAGWDHAGVLATGAATGPWGLVAGSAAGASVATWGQASAALNRAAAAPWGAAGALAGGSVAAPWLSSAQAAALASIASWGRAGAFDIALLSAWQRPTSPASAIDAPWQASARVVAGSVAFWQWAALAAPRSALTPWGAAVPAWGSTDPIIEPPQIPPSLVLRRVNLHLCRPLGPGRLNLALGPQACPPRAVATLTIPARSSYMQHHIVNVQRLPDLAVLPFTRFDLSTDASTFGWTFSGSGPESLLDDLAPVSGVPARLRVTIDGAAWEVLVEGRRRNRAFGQRTATVTARSTAVLLGDPYMAERAFISSVPMTAAQLAADALDGTGVGLDWQCTDWLVPAGAWSFTGTPLGAVRRIADAIGASLASPRAGDTVAVVPRYPTLPWNWATTTPDVALASLDPVLVEGYEQADRPAYEGVYVSGQTAGSAFGLVKRAGTGPALYAPMVTEALATHPDAVRQRGESILGGAGPQANMTLALPVLAGVGVIDPGKLLAVADPDEPWRGLVRGVRVTVDGPSVQQTLTVERHL
jgi:hypothetical protein